MPGTVQGTPPAGQHGWLVLDKPEGMTSNAANMRVRRMLQCRGTGFAGTLDPLASGILPVAVGHATRLLPWLMRKPKSYTFTVRWGLSTLTGDREGPVTATSAHTPTPEDIQAVLPRMQGTIMQTPPVSSAIKVQGIRACDRMRRGEHVVLAPRPVSVDALYLVSHDAGLRLSVLEVRCGSGTYVRSLATGLAELLDTQGHVISLRRTAVGPFDEACAFSLVSLEKTLHSGCGQVLKPMDVVLDDIPDIAVTEAEALMIRHGRPLPLRPPALDDGAEVWFRPEGVCQVLATGQVRGGQLCPVRVFMAPPGTN